MKYGEVRDVAGMMSGIDLAASFARVYCGEENEFDGEDKYTSSARVEFAEYWV